jgi:hypothetical protein
MKLHENIVSIIASIGLTIVYILICVMLFSGCQTSVRCLYLEGNKTVEICDDGTTNELDCSGEKCTRTPITRTMSMDMQLHTWLTKLE